MPFALEGAQDATDTAPKRFKLEGAKDTAPAAPAAKISAMQDVKETLSDMPKRFASGVVMALPNIVNQAVAGPQELYRGMTGRNRDFSPLWKPFYGSEDVFPTHQPTTPAGMAVDTFSNVLSQVTGGKSGKTMRENPTLIKYIREDLRAPDVAYPKNLLTAAGGARLEATPKAIEGAHSILHTALKEDAINPLDVAQRLEEAKATGLPIRAMDVITKETEGVQTHGKNTLGLLKGAANMPGQGAAMAGEVAARRGTTTKRIGAALDTHLTDKGVYEVSDAALKKMETETPKAYKKAFEGGSIAPLEKQFEREFQTTSAQKSAAQQKINQAQHTLLQIEANKQTNANVYVGSGLIAQKRKAVEALQKAQKEYAQIGEKEAATKDMLRQAQSDRKNGVKGAVWSPRINEMLSDDTVQAGIRKGLWIAKKEALAKGEKFNPSEYGITGYDKTDEPIVSKVPNMRMLDAGKKGLDAIINESKNPLTGKMNETGRAVSMLKNSYLKEIDAVNPDYAAARSQYGSQASQLEALNNGRDFKSMDKEEIARFMKDPNTSKAEKAAFATGVRRTLQETLDKDPSNPVKQLWTPYMREKLQAVFPNKQAFDKFSRLMEHENAMAYTNNALATQSHTNLLGNFQKAIATPSKVLKAVTNPTGAATDAIMGTISNKLGSKAANLTKEQAAVITRYLTTDDPQLWYDLAGRDVK